MDLIYRLRYHVRRHRHGEEGVSPDLKHLPSKQMDHMGPDELYLASMPFLYWQFFQEVEVFVVAGYEQYCKRQTLQPVQCLTLFFASVPYSAEVAADDDMVTLCHIFLFGKVLGMEAKEVAVGISGCKDQVAHSNL